MVFSWILSDNSPPASNKPDFILGDHNNKPGVTLTFIFYLSLSRSRRNYYVSILQNY